MLEEILELWPILVIFPAIVAVGFYGFFKHAIKHTDGSDDIQTADEAQKGLMSSIHHTNLANVKSEVQTARGSKPSLDARLDVGIKEDGSFKGLFGNYQDITGENHDYGLLRVEVAYFQVNYQSVDWLSSTWTFGTAFNALLGVWVFMTENTNGFLTSVVTHQRTYGATNSGVQIQLYDPGAGFVAGDWARVYCLAIGVA